MQPITNTITIHKNDNVAVVIDTQNTKIPFGHKIAIADIKADEEIIKYGASIGKATANIAKGEHVHSHNLTTNLDGMLGYSYEPVECKPVETNRSDTFLGYRRPNGKVGIRNEIWIINTVGCVNKTAERIVNKATKALLDTDNVDGIFTFVHPYGCSQLGDDHTNTQQILKNLVNHPNAAGVLVLGLGCENNNIDEFKKVLGTWDDSRVKFLTTQDVSDEETEALSLIQELVTTCNQSRKREEIPVSELVVGLKCGGSDGLSGITANTLVGRFSDMLIAQGGSCLLTEVPEMFGAETLLMARCIDQTIFNKTVSLINNFKGYFFSYNQSIYENPSPGNIEGGITTLEEKSLGCTQKGGDCPVVDVLGYGESIKKPGLNLLNGPGNDLVAVTNLTAAGAHIVLFTTGRGTPFGGPVPTIKISSNTALAKNKANWIDFDAGGLLENPKLGDRLLDYVINVASGEKTKNEVNDYREIAIFKDGVTL